MRIFSYRNKRRLKQLLLLLAVAAAVLFLCCVCRFIYLERFLVYSDGTIQLDYEQALDRQPQKSKPGWDPNEVQIITKDPAVQEVDAADEPMKQLTGYYITTEMLRDLDNVHAAMSETDAPQTVMMDLKSIYGNFYYNSGTYGAITATSADTDAIEALIAQLDEQDGVYLIARIASLSDYNFALANQPSGLAMRSGALWMDSEGCFWLDPLSTTVQEHLVSIAQELALMGFDEIVFDDFRIPDSSNIVYNSELTREEAAAEGAAQIRTMLSTDSIRVSFNSSNPLVAEHSDRVYLVTESGSEVAGLVETMQETVEDPAAQIVFLTASRDTRFSSYGLLRPLIEARAE